MSRDANGNPYDLFFYWTWFGAPPTTRTGPVPVIGGVPAKSAGGNVLTRWVKPEVVDE